LAAAPVKVAGLLVEVLLLDIVVYVKAELVVGLATRRELGMDDVTNEAIDGRVVDDLVVGVVADDG
jgi:hypothetical protein